MSADVSPGTKLPLVLAPEGRTGGLQKRAGDLLGIVNGVEGAAWYVADETGQGLTYRFPQGALRDARWLTADMLLDGRHLAVFELTLSESGNGGGGGPTFRLIHGALNQCSARIRLPLEAVNQNRWRLEREGAWLKQMCSGDVVDLAKVDRMTYSVIRKSDEPVCWCMTRFTASADEPPLLAAPELPKGPLIDELGQSTIHDWPGKSGSADEVTALLKAQAAAASAHRWPEGFSRWGGWEGAGEARRLEGTGFFRTHSDGGRWWLVDPEGWPFWSAGIDCVQPNIDANFSGLEKALAWIPDRDGEYAEAFERHGLADIVDYHTANFVRAFGPDQWRSKWAEIALAELRRYGFNTVANWSDWQMAREAGFPYVRPLGLSFSGTPRTSLVFRDFPDVFHPGFAQDVKDYADELRETADDPALVGYFLMNEPTWGFAKQLPAEGMLLNTPSCHGRRALAEFLRERHRSDAELSRAWGVETAFEAVADGPWEAPVTDAAREDLAEFSTVMVTRLFDTLSEACKAVDPNHLNLGARYYTVPPGWAIEGMKSFDVFSINCYRERVPADELARVARLMKCPVMVGEWHFGALDAGLPASGIGHVRTQADRGRAFRVYTETAAAIPECVGVHYFTLYDQSALGRFDGENYQIGFLDTCNRPYDELARAARESHERLYRVAAGEIEPTGDAPEYLPKLFA